MEGFYIEFKIDSNCSHPQINLNLAKFQEENSKLVLPNNNIYELIELVFSNEEMLKLNSSLYNQIYRCIPENTEFKTYYNKNNNELAFKFKREVQDIYEILFIDKKEIEG